MSFREEIDLCRCVHSEDGEVEDMCFTCIFGPMRTIRYYLRDDEVAENMEWVIAFVRWLRRQHIDWVEKALESIYSTLENLEDYDVQELKEEILQTRTYIEMQIEANEQHYDDCECEEERVEHFRDMCRGD